MCARSHGCLYVAWVSALCVKFSLVHRAVAFVAFDSNHWRLSVSFIEKPIVCPCEESRFFPGGQDCFDFLHHRWCWRQVSSVVLILFRAPRMRRINSDWMSWEQNRLRPKGPFRKAETAICGPSQGLLVASKGKFCPSGLRSHSDARVV